MLLNIADLINLFGGEGDYPFGSEFISAYSIYTSERIYVVYTLFSTIILLLAVLFAFKLKTRLSIVFLFAGAILFFYPIITACN